MISIWQPVTMKWPTSTGHLWHVWSEHSILACGLWGGEGRWVAVMYTWINQLGDASVWPPNKPCWSCKAGVNTAQWPGLTLNLTQIWDCDFLEGMPCVGVLWCGKLKVHHTYGSTEDQWRGQAPTLRVRAPPARRAEALWAFVGPWVLYLAQSSLKVFKNNLVAETINVVSTGSWEKAQRNELRQDYVSLFLASPKENLHVRAHVNPGPRLPLCAPCCPRSRGARCRQSPPTTTRQQLCAFFHRKSNVSSSCSALPPVTRTGKFK